MLGFSKRARGIGAKRLAMLPLVALAIGVLVWFGADLSYALVLRFESAQWEAQVARDPDGVRCGCREFSVGHGDTALLLVHGFGDSPAVFRLMAPALAARGFTCRAMRLPNCATPIERYRSSTAADWRAAVRAELASLRRTHSRVVVIAHSLGAAIAVDCLANDAAAADGLILLAPLIEVSNRHSPVLTPEAWYQVLDRAMIFTDRIGTGAETSRLIPADPYIPRDLYRQLFALVEANRRRAQLICVPLMMVLARDDDVVDNPAAESFYRGCAGGPKLLKYIAGGHVIPVDTDWRTTVQGIAGFVGGISSSAGPG